MNKNVLGDRYELGEMIGTGGMADVFIAQDTRLAKKVAIKILRRDLARDPSFVARFRKEALAAAGLNHPGIVSVFDSGEEITPSGSSPYIVMEYVPGHTLREITNKGERLTSPRAIEIIAEILVALDDSHHHGIIHRDIKPANIMLTAAGAVKVMDFGIARALDDVGATMTNTWNVIGTAQYLSPEQAIGSQADARSDLYSLACLFYELLTGKPPFTGDTPVAIAYQHVSGVFTPLSQIFPESDSALDTFFSIALAKKPEERYQSAQLMLEDLHRLARGEVITTKIPKHKGRKAGQKRLQLLTALFLTFLLIAGVSSQLFKSATPSLISLANVVGLTEAQAREQLIGFTITINRAPDARIPKNRVASQLPLATSNVPRNSSVTLTLSDGLGDAVVPIGLIGKSLLETRNLLSSVGLLISRTIPIDSEEAPGTVLSVSPESGSTIPAGSGVILEIASGNTQIPLLVGLTDIQAITILTQAGFLVKIVQAYDANSPIGFVLAQAPEAGTTKVIGSSVTITINKNPT